MYSQLDTDYQKDMYYRGQVTVGGQENSYFNKFPADANSKVL